MSDEKVRLSLDHCRICGQVVTDYEPGGFERDDAQRGHHFCERAGDTSVLADMFDIARRIYEYAQGHYDDGGWDVIVECYTHQQIVAAVWGSDEHEVAVTYEAALAEVSELVSIYADREADAQNSRF